MAHKVEINDLMMDLEALIAFLIEYEQETGHKLKCGYGKGKIVVYIP